MYADFNKLTLEIALEALFGFTVAAAGGEQQQQGAGGSAGQQGPGKIGGPRQGARGAPSAAGRTGSRPHLEADQAAEIVRAVEKAFEFFTKRAGSAMMLPEWVPTLDNLEFGLAVQQLDKVSGKWEERGGEGSSYNM